MRTPRIIVLSLALAALTLTPASAARHDTALSPDGDLYQVGPVALGEPGSKAGDIALVLDISHADRPAERLVVPGTEGPEVESTPFLLMEEKSNTVFMVWESRRRYIYSSIYLAGYSPQRGWSEVVEISGDLYSIKSTPQVAVTRDVYIAEAGQGEEAQRRHRTIFHVVWWEQASEGEQAVYSPVALIDGDFQLPNPFFVLDGFDAYGGQSAAASVQGLARSPTVQAGRDSRSVVIAFTRADSGRLVSLEAGVLPQAISHLAERARAEILDVGRQRPGRRELAERARAEILDVGGRWHRDFARYLASSAADLVLAGGDGEEPVAALEELAAALRDQLRTIGSRLTVGSQAEELATSVLVEVAQTGLTKNGTDLAPALLNLRLASNRPAPAVGDEPTLFLSPSGDEAIAAWREAPGQLSYVESRGEGWSEVQSLLLGEELSLEAALDLLARRARTR